MRASTATTTPTTDALLHLERCRTLVAKHRAVIDSLRTESQLLQLCVVDCRGELQRQTSELHALSKKYAQAESILISSKSLASNGENDEDIETQLEKAAGELDEMEKRIAANGKNDIQNSDILHRIRARSEFLEKKERASIIVDEAPSSKKDSSTPLAGTTRKRRRTSPILYYDVAGSPVAVSDACPTFPVVLPTTTNTRPISQTYPSTRRDDVNDDNLLSSGFNNSLCSITLSQPPGSNTDASAVRKTRSNTTATPKSRPRPARKGAPSGVTPDKSKATLSLQGKEQAQHDVIPSILSTEMNQLLAKKGDNLAEIRRYTPVRRFGTTFSISGSLPPNNLYARAMPLLGRKFLCIEGTRRMGAQEGVWKDVCAFAREHRLGTPENSTSFEKGSLYALMCAVFRCGGMQVVVGMNAWKYVATTVAAGCENISYVKAKKFYAKWAYPYEHMLVFGEMVHKHVHLLLWRYNWSNADKYCHGAKGPKSTHAAQKEKNSALNKNNNINRNADNNRPIKVVKSKKTPLPLSPERILPPPQQQPDNTGTTMVQHEHNTASQQISVETVAVVDDGAPVCDDMNDGTHENRNDVWNKEAAALVYSAPTSNSGTQYDDESSMLQVAAENEVMAELPSLAEDRQEEERSSCDNSLAIAQNDLP